VQPELQWEQGMKDLGVALDTVSDEARLIAQSAADFYAGKQLLARARSQRGQLPGYSEGLWREMAELGWTGLHVGEAWGGSEAPLGHWMALARESGKALASEPLVAAAVLAGEVIAQGDNQALKDQLLTALVEGRCTPALAWQEPGRGQDRSAQLRAELVPDGGVLLSGHKCFVPQGAGADGFVVSAQWADSDLGQALFWVDAHSPGLTVKHHARIDGGFWTELSLSQVPVARDQLIAQGESAQRVLGSALDMSTMVACAEMVGVMQQALEISVEYIRTRVQFDHPIGSFQALQHKTVDLLVALEIARSVVSQNTRWYEDSTDAATRAMLASQTKARCTESIQVVTKGCIQLHGGMGYTDEADIGMFLKRAMVLSSWLGGSDFHRARYAAFAQAGVTTQPQDDAGSMAEVRDWLEQNFPQRLRFPDHRLDWSDATDWLERLHAKGWAAPNWPKEWGGMGLSAYDQVRFQEECDRVGMNIAPNLGASMLGPLLIRYGSEAQRREHLPRILSGEVRWCQGYSEPGAGSDLANLRTSAVEDGEHFVVNGQKIWTSFAFDAHMMFMLVRTDNSGRKQDGISFLLVDMKTPGITIRRIRNLTGSAEFCEVFFDNVRVPRANLVGALNQGWKMAKSLLGSERIMLASPRLARYPLRLLGDYARTHGLDQNPVFRHRFTQLQMDVDDLGAAFVLMVDALRRGHEPGAEISILKLWTTETFQRVADLLLHTAGESATLDSALSTDAGTKLHAANLYLAARAATIYGGSSEVQRNILAKAVLELPGA
jgi:alkylation response protein AidB-like acyl-CoA dehydrogenase